MTSSLHLPLTFLHAAMLFPSSFTTSPLTLLPSFQLWSPDCCSCCQDHALCGSPTIRSPPKGWEKMNKKSSSIQNPLVETENRAAMKRPIKVAKKPVSPNITFPAQSILTHLSCNLHKYVCPYPTANYITASYQLFWKSRLWWREKKRCSEISDTTHVVLIFHQHQLFPPNA